MPKMPVLFVGHGSPMNIVEKNRFTDSWREMAAMIPAPEAILCVSAHWYSQGLAISSTEHPETIHDFYGFPPELYELRYPAPGAPNLAALVAEKLPGLVRIDPERGLDHGAWSILHFIYPEADIPVCQLSVNASFSPLESYQVGQSLSFLRDEGVLILGSGDVVHNLNLVDWDMSGGYDWADDFDSFIKESVVEGRHDRAVNYKQAGPAAERAFYSRDHYDPLLYVLGATAGGEAVRVLNDERIMGALSMTSFVIG